MQQQTCPQCQRQLALNAAYVPWCECGWNIKPHALPESYGMFEQMYTNVSKRLGKQMLHQMRSLNDLKPRWTASKVIVGLMACSIHGFTLLILGLGLLLLIDGWPNPFAVVFGVVLLGMVWILRPTWGKLPKDGLILTPKEAPNLFELLNRMTTSLGAKPIEVVVIDEDFNAFFGRLGWRRTHVLGLGLPLWLAMSNQERIALIAHEIGHSINNDSNRSLLISSAIHALATWIETIYPPRLVIPELGLKGFLLAPFNLLLRGFCLILLWWLKLMVLLAGRERQRAEYLADYKAAELAGSSAAIDLLDRLHLDDSCHLAIQRAVLSPAKPHILQSMAEHVATIPAHERERLRRVARLEGSLLDASHPPTAHRIEFLSTIAPRQALIQAEPTAMSSITNELLGYEAQVMQRLRRQWIRNS
ncbi:M48 family metallopeptidase [Herpetosiphon llansteffanensis]|uniref:M48 family metallopeptidase n=1 Tax=Herpetosiphon llansteffanensis TaxID=2094568 RepID=UPI000D7C199B|nr:M48 family metallopeptidase [Herpetosiphon llansteffanensis]